MPDIVCGSAVMDRSPHAYQSLRARRLRPVTLLVPESCADSLRDLARVLRPRHQGEWPARRLDGVGSVRAPS